MHIFFFISADNKMKFQFKHIKQESKGAFIAANCTSMHAVMHSVLNATFAANCIEMFFYQQNHGYNAQEDVVNIINRLN